MKVGQVVLVGTGGTIASRRRGEAVVAEVPVAELLEAADLHALDAGVRVRAVDVATSPSFALSLPEVGRLAVQALDALGAQHPDNGDPDDGDRDLVGADALALTHGTDSMEETAFLLDLLHAGDQPVGLAGAQRPHDDPERDRPGNLADLLRVLADPAAVGLGALVVFAGAAWPARGVRKVHTSDLRAYDAPTGPRLRVSPDGVRAVADAGSARSSIPGALDAVRSRGLVDVDVVALVPGDDGRALGAALDRGSRGVVLQALGIGNASPAVCDQVRRAVADGVPVLVTSRVHAGAVRPVYGAGGGVDLRAAGAVFADEQTTWQARVLLAVALAVSPASPLDDVVRPWLDRWSEHR